MKTLLIILILLIIIILVILAWLGAFKKVHVYAARQGGEILVYETIKGEYRQSAAAMDQIYYRLLHEDKIETFKGFGIYYDDPKKVSKDQLRSEAGCILEPADGIKSETLSEKYQVKVFPEGDYIVAEYPFRNKLSVFMSLAKVYPALDKYAKTHNYDPEGFVMEIYDIPNKKILYRKEIRN
ncbi:MAG: GyrI-like domain-containing protein [Bacteroidales bacterium]|nr:GyrI-like domain-containing protein [Bacteroidales bacterium]